MAKYKVYLKSGTVLEVQAGLVDSNQTFVHFYKKEPAVENVGSFPIEAIFGFYEADSVKQANELVIPINPAK